MEKVSAYVGTEPYIFISYSHKDDEQIQRILQEMISNGYRVWYDEGIASGSMWADNISKALKNCSQFVVMLTSNSAASEFVKNEVHIAVKNQLNIQVVYLEEVELEGGMELVLDRRQAISRFKFSNEAAFYKQLFTFLVPETRSVAEKMLHAKEMLQGVYDNLTVTYEKGFLTLYHAIHKNTGLPVFIKHFSTTDSVSGEETKRSAQNEITILKELQLSCCPYAPKLMDYFSDDSNIFIVQEFLGEKNLKEQMKDFQYKNVEEIQDRCVAIAINVAKALRYLHYAKSPIVHRDIKPQNLMLTEHGDVILVDYDSAIHYKDVVTDKVIRVGTVGYAPPEQYNGIPDPRADIYALGIMLFQLLTGRSVIEIKNERIQCGNRIDLLGYGCFHPALEDVVNKMIDLKVENRYADVDEVISALENYKRIPAPVKRSFPLPRVVSPKEARIWKEESSNETVQLWPAANGEITVVLDGFATGVLIE